MLSDDDGIGQVAELSVAPEVLAPVLQRFYSVYNPSKILPQNENHFHSLVSLYCTNIRELNRRLLQTYGDILKLSDLGLDADGTQTSSSAASGVSKNADSSRHHQTAIFFRHCLEPPS